MESTIVLFGGTFNPPHIGHIHCINSVLKDISPAKLILIPSFVPPVADGIVKPVSLGFQVRKKMCELLLKDSDLETIVEISDIETQIEPPSYTYKTLVALEGILENYSKAFFLIGDDQLKNFHLWSEAKKVLQKVNIIVVRRDKNTEFDSLIVKLVDHLKLSFKKKDNVYTLSVDNVKSSITVIDLCPVEISSTELRAHKRFGLTESLENYIKDNKLYLGE
jgi:nicotinate-nucleotide adenylyltransferase